MTTISPTDSPSLFSALKTSLKDCAGDVVFGMEDGTVSIFGLVLGVAATTRDPAVVLVAGASGAGAAAVSMMAGAYLEAKTDQALGKPTAPPVVRALWMLAADFFAAIVPILPFMLMPIAVARFVSIAITTLLLAGLGVGRARVAGEPLVKMVVETLAIGVGAAVAGIVIGLGVNHLLGK